MSQTGAIFQTTVLISFSLIHHDDKCPSDVILILDALVGEFQTKAIWELERPPIARTKKHMVAEKKIHLRSQGAGDLLGLVPYGGRVDRNLRRRIRVLDRVFAAVRVFRTLASPSRPEDRFLHGL